MYEYKIKSEEYQVTVELMIYALVAAGLIFWLRSILGTKNEGDVNRPAPNLELSEDGKIVGLGCSAASDKNEKTIALVEELAKNSKGNMSIGSNAAEQGLVEIIKTDKGFDVYVFLQAAQDAFAYIVESFAEGDRETLKDLLGEEVYNAFDNAIAARENSGETMVSEVHAIKKSEIVEAHLNDKNAFVTVRFWADETSVTRDEDSNIISGHPEKTTLMRDVWTFSRDLKSRDPRWLVVETREDGDEDNDIIPNTH